MDIINQDFCFIGKKSKIIGDLVLNGPTHIGGEVEGNISIADDSKLIIEPTAVIQGTIKGSTVEIYGVVHGDISARENLKVFPSATINGKLTAKSLKVLPGAKLNIIGHTKE